MKRLFFRLWTSTCFSSYFPQVENWKSTLREDVGHLLGIPLSSTVVAPGLLGSGPNVAPMTWLEILGDIGSLLSAFDAQLLFASSGQFNVVEQLMK